VKNIEARTIDTVHDESLSIGIDYLAKRGVSAFLTSTLGSTDAQGHDLGITISNRMLLRGVIRPLLIDMFGLKTGDFLADEYCILRRPVTDATLSRSTGQEGTLEALAAFVNGSSEVQILLGFSADVVPGVTAHATLDLRLTFTVSRQIAGASQVLQITTTLANPRTAVTSKRVDFAWWIYVLAALLPGLVGAAALLVVAVLDGIVSELIESERLADAIKLLSVPPSANPLSLPVTLFDASVELNDPSAPPMPTPSGPMLSLIFGAAAHDLYVGARFRRLPGAPSSREVVPLSVTFQIPDSADPGARLDGIGGPLTSRTEWVLSVDEAVALVDAGHRMEVNIPRADPVAVITAVSASGVPYLRTVADDFGTNNLGNLPKRIPAASSTLGP
jgi:hypothetical protein